VSRRSVYEQHLRTLGAEEFAHVDGTLERHLHGTERLLRSWGNREAVCIAGLYHAVYGTDGIAGHLVGLDARNAIAEVIGVEAEALAYLYGACDRARYHPRIGTASQQMFVDRFAGNSYAISAPTLRDFCEITVANELELALRNPRFGQRHAAELLALFDRMRGVVSEAALGAACDVLSMTNAGPFTTR